jgi:hypothetical protein
MGFCGENKKKAQHPLSLLSQIISPYFPLAPMDTIAHRKPM